MIRSTSPRLSQPTALRNKRIGKKALLAVRLAHALEVSAPKNPRKDSRKALLRPKFIAATLAGILVLGTFGLTAAHLYSTRLAESQKVEAAKENALRKEQAARADTCRRAKVEQKADLIGRVTYDELYDGNECDK